MFASTVAAAPLDKKSNFEFQLEDEIALFYFISFAGKMVQVLRSNSNFERMRN